MIPIPGVLIALLTFPGVIVHEAAHLLFCKLRRVAVFDVCFFRIPPADKWFSSAPIGYVIHERPENFTSAFLISVGPFLVNSVLCLLFCFPAFFPIRVHGMFTPEVTVHGPGRSEGVFRPAKWAAIDWVT